MLLKLFLAFTIIPVVEIYLLIQIGSAFGVFTSIALVVFTGFLGAYLARIQGLTNLIPHPGKFKRRAHAVRRTA